MIYIIKGLLFTHKRHLNQMRKRLLDDADSGHPEEKEVVNVIYDPIYQPLRSSWIWHKVKF